MVPGVDSLTLSVLLSVSFPVQGPSVFVWRRNIDHPSGQSRRCLSRQGKDTEAQRDSSSVRRGSSRSSRTSITSESWSGVRDRGQKLVGW